MADAARQVTLRQAGQAYLERVVAQAKRGRDSPYATQASTGVKSADIEADQDVEIVGKIIANSRHYILCGLWLLCCVTQLVLIKVRSLLLYRFSNIHIFKRVLYIICKCCRQH